MQEQMQKRINNYSGDLPIWAWQRYPNNVKVKKRFGENQVKITALAPLERCLISDFDLYEYGVLNKGYLSYDVEKMKDQFKCTNLRAYNKNKGTRLEYKFNPTQKELESGWELIFNLKKPPIKFENYIINNKQGRYLQICVDRIYQNEIKKIKIY